MLVTLDEMKTYLGIPLVDTTYDDFLTQQITVVSDSIEGYCGRKFNLASYTQTFYQDEMVNEYDVRKLTLFHFPIDTISSVTEIDTSYILGSGEYRLHALKGFLKRIESGVKIKWFESGSETIEVVYDAGYTDIPSPIQQVVYALVSEGYNKKAAGLGIDFGNDVQSISIPGTLAINFDYTLQANDRKSTYGMILGNYVNVLDIYRSERALIGSIEENYVS